MKMNDIRVNCLYNPIDYFLVRIETCPYVQSEKAWIFCAYKWNAGIKKMVMNTGFDK